MEEARVAPQEVTSTTTQRFLFIDLYRSAVILLMLEGHVVLTFLRSEERRVGKECRL